jgi:hypothetical protein
LNSTSSKAGRLTSAQPNEPTVAAAELPKHIGWKRARWTSFALAMNFILYRFVPDRDEQSRPSCHKVIMSALLNWQDRHGKTNEFPNINGGSTVSLNAIDATWHDHRVSEKYNYVPGLRNGDPDDLVLMYLRVPTCWKWHASPATVFAEKEWIVIPVE